MARIFLKILDRLEETLIMILIMSATLIIFVAVVHRYLSGYAIPYLQDWLLGINLSWAQELCIIMFVWMAKFGAAYGVRSGIHVGVDVLLNRFPDKLQRKVVLFGLFAGATFTAVIASAGAYFIWHNGLNYAICGEHPGAFCKALGAEDGLYPGPVTPDLQWPTWFVYMAIPLGSTLMCFRFLQVAWRFAHGHDLPAHEHNYVEGLDLEEEVKP